MSDLIRKEFESAMSLETGLSIELFELDRNGDSYLSTGPKYAWWAWQASRECLVIELPEDFPFSKEPKYQSSRQQTISECRAAIHAAGVKTK